MRVKEVERITGVHSHTIRYYSRLGLLAPQRNPANRYREFDCSDIRRLRFIRQAKALGFELQEIELILRRIGKITGLFSCCQAYGRSWRSGRRWAS